jgi:hypothetical protein
MLHLITLKDTYTLDRTPLDKGSAHRRDLYLYNTKYSQRQTSVPQAGFAPASPTSERPQRHTSDRAVSAIGIKAYTWFISIMPVPVADRSKA